MRGIESEDLGSASDVFSFDIDEHSDGSILCDECDITVPIAIEVSCSFPSGSHICDMSHISHILENPTMVQEQSDIPIAIEHDDVLIPVLIEIIFRILID